MNYEMHECEIGGLTFEEYFVQAQKLYLLAIRIFKEQGRSAYVAMLTKELAIILDVWALFLFFNYFFSKF